MRIRYKLTIQFVSLIATILFVASTTIFILFDIFNTREFTNQLAKKATFSADLILNTNHSEETKQKLMDIEFLKVEMIIWDSSGDIKYNTDHFKNYNLSSDKINKIRSEKTVIFENNKLEQIGISYLHNGKEYLIIAEAEDILGHRKVRFLGIILLIVFSISILTIYLTGWLFAGNALQPIVKIMGEVNGISEKNLHERIDEGNGQDEIAQLSITFNKLLSRIETAFKAKRAFIGNVSHELRNPLSLIKGQLEINLLHDRKPEEYKNLMISLLEDINNLTSITNRMLSLAQVSGLGMIDKKEIVRVDDLLMQVSDDLRETNPEFKVSISFASEIESEELLEVSGNETLLRNAFLNLTENACKYSFDHICLITIETKNNTVIIQFTDKGLGIPKEDLEHIFEPFYRGKNVIDRKGFGIGLSLVEKVINLHNGSIEISSVENVGTTFTIVLPVGASQ